MPRSTQVAFFGKLPSVLDYVRIHHTSDAAIVYDRWLERCQQDLARTGAAWPDTVFRFVFSSTADSVLVGVIAPSRDRAGRRFPATIYAVLPAKFVSRVGLVPEGCAAFFEAAEAALHESTALKLEQFDERLAEIAPPSSPDLDAQISLRQAMLTSRSLADLARAPRAADLCQMQAALQRCVQGLEASGVAHDRSPVLSCPVRDGSDVIAWLTLAEKKLVGQARFPWCFWTLQAARPGLYLGQGEVPSLLPVWISSSHVKSERFWDLRPSEFDDTAATVASRGADFDGQGESAPSLESAFERALEV